MKKFVHFLILIAIISLSCSAATDLVSGGSDVSGPILAVVTAASLDEQGQIVDQSSSFAPAAPQVTVVVQVGALQAAAPLSIAWYRAGDAGDEKLFEHTVQVESFDRAYSVGLNPGLLAPGAYKSVVSLGGQQQTVSWIVAEPESEPGVDISQSADAAQSQPGRAPTSGASGKVPASQRAAGQPPSKAGCSPEAGILQRPPNVTAWGGILEITGSCIDPGGGDLVVMASIAGGQPKQACHFSLASGLSCAYTGDPCTLPGELDLPGTVVNVDLRQKSGQVLAHDTTTLAADKDAPDVPSLVSEPSNGVPVKAGDTITILSAEAEESKSAGWQSGVSKIEIWVTKPFRQKIGEEPSGKSRAACTAKSWDQKTKQQHTYDVPKGLTGDLVICAYAYDFDGNTGKKCYTYPTGKKLKGKLNLMSTDSVTTATITQTGTHQTEAELSLSLQADGTVTGTADVTYSYHVEGTQKCGGFSSSMVPNPTHFSVPVTGTWTKDKIVFQMTSNGPIERSFTDDTCGTASNYDADVAAAALGAEWQADKVGEAYTADQTFHATASSTTHWTIQLEPPAPGVG